MSSTAPREHLVDALEADLVGPFDAAAPEEVLTLAPSRWYLTGFLAPVAGRDFEDPTKEDDLANGTEEDDDETGGAEPEAKQKNLFPASMGLSVLLPAKGAASDVVRATLSFAEYVGEQREVDGKKERKLYWRRMPRGPFEIDVPLDAAKLIAGIPVKDTVGVRLKGRLETTSGQGLPTGTRALSLFVVNQRTPHEDRAHADEQFLFQVKLAVEHVGGFVPRPNRRDEDASDWDDKVADLQYRHKVEWAVGHNVSVGAASATRVETSWLPRHVVRRVETCDAPGVETSMEALAALPDGAAVKGALLPLVDAYRAWIATQRRIAVDSPRREETRDELTNNATRACERIRIGIERLATDAALFEAFRLANRAMALAARQRSPQRYATVEHVPRWRLFQLAFVVMSLVGLAEPTHADRETVDLIFFPTGGGKTEAYLGVIAITLLLRRIHGRARPDGGLGVAVLLRYTLRLLTLDQLSRAATLICALETLRKEAGDALGDVRFSVGLWVGRSATANTITQVKDAITEYKNSASKNAPSPCPLTHCPWCATELGRDSLRVPRDAPDEVVTACLSMTCPFNDRSGGLPVLFVDEAIYRELPSFLVATVDKFAMLPWRGETGMLFGRARARVGRLFYGPMDEKPPKGALLLPDGLPPPDLIVQDELHLIAGPLGTMVGLYETAIEHLSTSSDGVRPKIIASTATVRRAQHQVSALFGRKSMALFPPHGVNESDTFFANVVPESDGRLYVGIAAPGRSMKAILLRAYVDALAAAQKSFDPRVGGPPAADALMTLVGYFNSLRELGGMRRLVEDEVRDRCRKILERVPETRGTANPWFGTRDIQADPVELTSREKTAMIAGAKARLALAHTDKEHVDVVLASNMISVGVDIDRLGLMVVAGQPKTTSEYIQATSRVGRQHPGLVITCFNVRKPRDRSHYERFAAYHDSFYRFVEAQSLTPFSGPALERGLAGTLLAMTRLAAQDATPALAAMAMKVTRPLGELAMKALADRRAKQPGADTTADAATLAQRVKNLLDAWDRLVADIGKGAAGKIDYSPYDRAKAASVHMLHTPLDDERPELGTDYAKFRAPTSMRDVEPSVHLWIERGRSLGGKR